MEGAFNTIKQQTSELAKSAGDTIGNIQKSAQESINNVQSSVNEFSTSTSTAAANSGFFTANGLIAKFAFLILVIIVFLILLNLGIHLIYYFTTSSSNSVYLINGMIDGNSFKIISQDPSVSKQIVSRSTDQVTGIEFTWSVWLKLDGFPANTMTTDYQPIFVKGGGRYNAKGVSAISNGPGVYFSTGKSAGSTKNSIHILMDTISNSESSSQVIDITNIPITKWFHLCIRCENKYLDVYINGIVKYRLQLNTVPLQNYDSVEVCGNGGYNGKLSNLTYYNRALNIVDINGLVSNGPNTANADASKGNYGGEYLSTLWYS